MASFEEKTNAEIMTKLIAARISFCVRFIGTEVVSMVFYIEAKNLTSKQLTTIVDLGGSLDSFGMLVIIGLPVGEQS